MKKHKFLVASLSGTLLFTSPLILDKPNTVVFATTNSVYNTEQQRLIAIIDAKIIENKSDNSVFVAGLYKNYSSTKANPDLMKNILTEITNEKEFSVLNGSNAYTYDLSGNIKTKEGFYLTKEETDIFEKVEANRIKFGGNDVILLSNGTKVNLIKLKNNKSKTLNGVIHSIIKTNKYSVVDLTESNIETITFDLNGKIIDEKYSSKSEELKQSKETKNDVLTTGNDVANGNNDSKVNTAPNEEIVRQEEKIVKIEEKIDTAITNNSQDAVKVEKLTELQKELQKLNASRTTMEQTDAKLDAKITALDKELEALTKKTNQNTKDIQINAQELKEQKTLLQKLSDTLENLIKSLDSLITLIKSIFGF